MKRKRKLPRGLLISVITAALVCISAVSVLIANIFIPVKYLSAYINFTADERTEGNLRIRFINVGYGDSTFIEFPDGKTALIDAGNGSRANTLKILKLLNRSKIQKIDYLICSSVRSERCGGLAEIVKYKQIGKIFMPYCVVTNINEGYRKFHKQAEKAKSDGVEVEFCEYGAGVFLSEYQLCFLAPSPHTKPEGEYAQMNKNPTYENVCNASALIYLRCGGAEFLFCGDVGESVYERLTESYYLNGEFDMGGVKININNIDVVKIGNHGAANAAYAPFYDIISPKTAILSVGENARGYPELEAIATVQNKVSDKLYRTDKDGTVTVILENGKLNVSKEKE